MLRALMLLAVALAGIGSAPRSRDLGTYSSLDSRLLSAASLRLAHQSRQQVVAWLNRQPAVRVATIGSDGQTVDIRYRDGLQSAILPRSIHTAPLLLRSRLVPQARPGAPGPRAIVLEPFADELGLGSTAGDVEVSYLQKAGFQVDQIYNENATVAAMAGLSQYNVVYMHTHSGPTAGGDGAFATGQPANGDPTVAPLIQNGSVITVTVSGNGQQYYAVTSSYITNYEQQFPHDSLVFLNGCDLLDAPVFWQALNGKGVGVMVSWNAEATSKDNYLGAAAFFYYMDQGMSVGNAIVTEEQQGYGVSEVGNQGQALMGFRGDGGITLARVAAGAPAAQPTAVPTIAPPPPPAPTARPTSVPPTAAPSPTLRPIAGPPIAVNLLHRVAPGARQIITIHSHPHTVVHVSISFPNGDQRKADVTTDGAGTARYSFVQQPSVITFNHLLAKVTVQASSGPGISTVTTWYRIRFSPLDLSVQPRKAKVSSTITIWAHTRSRTTVVVYLRFSDGASVKLHGRTGPKGWIHLHYKVDRYAKKPVVVSALARFDRKTHEAVTTFTIIS